MNSLTKKNKKKTFDMEPLSQLSPFDEDEIEEDIEMKGLAFGPNEPALKKDISSLSMQIISLENRLSSSEGRVKTNRRVLLLLTFVVNAVFLLQFFILFKIYTML